MDLDLTARHHASGSRKISGRTGCNLKVGADTADIFALVSSIAKIIRSSIANAAAMEFASDIESTSIFSYPVLGGRGGEKRWLPMKAVERAPLVILGARLLGCVVSPSGDGSLTRELSSRRGDGSLTGELSLDNLKILTKK